MTGRRRTRVAAAIAVVMAVTALPLATGRPATAEAPPDGLTTQTVLTGLDVPVNFAFDPDGRIYVAEKRGTVRLFDGAGDTTPTTVIDVNQETYDHWDRGLLGITLDPELDSGRPYLYLLYSYNRDPFGAATVPRWPSGGGGDTCPTPPGANQDGCTSSGRLVRYTLRADGTAAPASRVILLDGVGSAGGWCHQFPSHSIGDVQFGPDGMLYVGSGDGASFNNVDHGQYGSTTPSAPTPANPCNDRPGTRGTPLAPATSTGGALRSQAVRSAPASGYVTWDGAILRVDPDTGAAAPGNPLRSNGIAGDDRIVAYGLRNPFRFGFRPGTSELWIGDVQWQNHEEINTFTTGPGQSSVPNFGWPCHQGPGRQSGYDNANLGLCESLYAAPTQSLGGVTSPLVAPHFSWPRAGALAPDCPTTGGGSVTAGRFIDNPDWPAGLQ